MNATYASYICLRSSKESNNAGVNSRPAQSVMLVSPSGMKKIFHILSISLFALIQLCAPLVHAHIDGNQGSPTIHVNEVPHNFSPIGLSQCHIETYESPAISIPHQNQNDRDLIIPSFCASSTCPISPAITILTLNPPTSLFSFASAYFRPHTQAPPLRS